MDLATSRERSGQRKERQLGAATFHLFHDQEYAQRRLPVRLGGLH
jgi:hypothetical protein